MKKLTILFLCVFMGLSYSSEDEFYGNIIEVNGKATLTPHWPLLSKTEYQDFLFNKTTHILETECASENFYENENQEEKKLCDDLKNMPIKSQADKEKVIQTYASFSCEKLYQNVDQLQKLNQTSNGASKESCIQGPQKLSTAQVSELKSKEFNFVADTHHFYLNEEVYEKKGVKRLPASND